MTERPKVLVTGGAGYIGSHCCKILSSAGFEPVTYDSLVTGYADAIQWGPHEQGSVCAGARIREVLQKHKPIAVFHLAALSQVGESFKFPDEYRAVNAYGTAVLVNAMKAEGASNLVFASSCAAAREDSPYGTSKREAERAIEISGLKHVIFRIFNACGASPDGEIGEAHSPETHLIPLAIDAAYKGTPLKVFGFDHPTPDGTCVRDYIHVMDIAEAFLSALTYLTRLDGVSAKMDLGTGCGASVKQIIDIVERRAGKKIQTEICPRREGDAPSLVASRHPVLRVLGFMPRRQLWDSVGDAVRWHGRDR